MNRQEFGQLIAALRKEHFNPIIGKVWSQKVLAEKSGLSEKVIGNIEQGQKVNFDSATLWQLADALQLTRLERQVLFNLPTGFDREQISTGQIDAARTAVAGSLSNVMLPALIHDACYNIVMVNRILLRFFHIPGHFFATESTANYNMLRLIFDPASPVVAQFGQGHHTMARNAIHCFRYLSLPYRYTDYFAQLIADLGQFSTFRQAWLSAKHEADDPVDHIHSMDIGELSCMVTTTSLFCSGAGDLYLTSFLPQNQPTFDYFGTLARKTGAGHRTLAPWPNPMLI